MKKFLAVSVAALLCVSMFGCGKKKEAMDELGEPTTMEALSIINATQEATPELKTVEAKPAGTVSAVTSQDVVAKPAANLEPLPPTGPYKPTGTEIQTALKNAGFYTGAIDGKIGPVSKKAIESFQKENGLTADGKVGPKTWEALSKYLNQSASTTKAKSKKKR